MGPEPGLPDDFRVLAESISPGETSYAHDKAYGAHLVLSGLRHVTTAAMRYCHILRCHRDAVTGMVTLTVMLVTTKATKATESKMQMEEDIQGMPGGSHACPSLLLLVLLCL